MTCRYCRQSAGWWRRTCAACERLAAVYRLHRGRGWGAILDEFIASGAERAEVERFLQAEIEAGVSVRDQIAADDANQLMGAFGTRREQTGVLVGRLRAKGAWRHYDKPPEGEGCG